MYLLLLDVMRIQNYIFSSNRLKDQIGASYLVESVIQDWVREELKRLYKNDSESIVVFGKKEADTSIFENEKVMAEIIYTGGGNAQILFRKEEDVKRFKLAYEKRLLKNAPGLNVAIAYTKWEEKEEFHDFYEKAQKELTYAKQNYVPTVFPISLGVTATCPITGHVAVADDSKGEFNTNDLISAELMKKRNERTIQKANEKMNSIVQEVADELKEEGIILPDWEVPVEFDKLGRTVGSQSYIGIIHIDGNGMGERFHKAVENFKGKGQEKEYIKALRKTSNLASNVGRKVVKQIIRAVLRSLRPLENSEEYEVAQCFSIKKEEGKYHLPFRFLIYGGDDLTFVCDARLALDLAALGLYAYESENLTACAGIAIIKSHYPFVKGYELAEQLCQNAKKMVRFFENNPSSALDWLIVRSGLIENIEKHREKYYRIKHSNEYLTLRPYFLKNYSFFNETVHWAWFRKEILGKLVDPEGIYSEHRSQIRGMAEIMPDGMQAVNIYLKRLKRLGIELPVLNKELSYSIFYNFNNKIGSPYLDAIELLEIIPRNVKWMDEVEG